MKEFKQPPFQQNAVAIAFTISVHAIAIVGLLYLGMSKPPEPPKQIKTVLIKPEDLKPVTREVTDFEETAHQNVKEEITQTADPIIDAPAVPVTPPVNMQQASTEAKKAEQQKKLAEQKAAEDARLANAKAIEEANAKAAADAKAKATADAKAKAAADAKAKATADAKAKATADAKAKAAADAKAKAAADAKAKATADAKAKAAADAKAKAAADAKANAEAEAKASSAKKAAEEAATKKAEAKRIASSAKKDFTNKIYRNWNTPSGSSGKTASARVTLSDSGSVLSVVVNASDPDMKASIEDAIRSAAPYPMPSDPDARREARTFTSSFTSK